MAKKKGVVKSQAIRDYLGANPKSRNKDVREGLAQQGVQVTDALISNVRSAGKAKRRTGRKKKAGRRKKVTTSRRTAPTANNDSVNVSDLVAARSFAEKVGGVDEARSLLNTLARIGGE